MAIESWKLALYRIVNIVKERRFGEELGEEEGGEIVVRMYYMREFNCRDKKEQHILLSKKKLNIQKQ